ncbi:flagellar transcriptional regulator FlhC [Thiohalocapsa marina]|uniref:Flagellar transcriptional regulator FlhC n=1 Tax=Thiohalocapsa marina TaxID=424902 RepID=A0A5M8FHP5_9GAMM|nr:FlhC family transcriptional regulator [Thiohalocapsa marina]KAA6184239.1 flagellar transcriptional regulator FlhC [Thiohalocapsa marina]
MRLERLNRTQQAVTLLQRGMRTSLVSHVSGLRSPVVRELHHEIHGDKPSGGPLPSLSGLLLSPRLRASASVFVALYRALGGTEVLHRVDLAALLKAHQLYQAQIEHLAAEATLGEPIDINAAWVIARDLTTGLARLHVCPHCAVHYLAGDLSRTALHCPLCILKRGRGWRRQRPPKVVPAETAPVPRIEATSPP